MGALLFLCATTVVANAQHTDDPVATVVDGESDRIPRHTVAPDYPRKARRDRIEGEVQVCYEIDRKGEPRRIAVRRSSHRAFEKASIKAIRESTYKPLKAHEALQSIKSCRTFKFSLVPAENDEPE